MKLTLFYAPMTCALVPFVALTEAGAPFEVESFNTRANAHLTPEFLALNPKHKVPVLLIDGVPLTENVAILTWIAQRFPEARLLPTDPDGAIQALSLMAWIASTIHPHLTHFPRPENHCDTPGSAVGVRRVGERHLREDFAIAEARLDRRDWLLGAFTIADVYFYWAFRRAVSFGLDLTAFPRCLALMARVAERPSVVKVLAFEKRVQAGFG
jgi:glutathione S-transferase